MTKYRIVQKYTDYLEKSIRGNTQEFGLRYVVESYRGILDEESKETNGFWCSWGDSYRTFEEAEDWLLDFKDKEEKSKIPPVVIKEYE